MTDSWVTGVGRTATEGPVRRMLAMAGRTPRPDTAPEEEIVNDRVPRTERIVVEHLDGWIDEEPLAVEPTTICWFDVPADAGA